MFFSKKKRVRESIALSATLAVAFTLNVAWIVNLVSARVPSFKMFFESVDGANAISGFYLLTGLVFLVVLGIGVLWFKGKDCSHYRDYIFWFFIVSLILFSILTIPFIYGFNLTM